MASPPPSMPRIFVGFSLLMEAVIMTHEKPVCVPETVHCRRTTR